MTIDCEAKRLAKEIRRLYPPKDVRRWGPELIGTILLSRIEGLELSVAQLRHDFEESQRCDPDD